MEKVVWNGDEDECWTWEAATTWLGYGKFSTTRSVWTPAHRVSHELFVGPIPEGLQIDHLCRNPRCVNPKHLEPVTPRENTMRGEAPSAYHAKKTHCPKGHPYSGDNLYVGAKGNRVCRACGREKARVKRQREGALV